MKTLEGQQAITYLEHLSTALPSEGDINRTDYCQGLLLLTILRIEKEFLKTRLDSPEDAYITIDSHGFPSMPIVLAHLGHALKWYQEVSNQRRAQAANWLDAVINLADDRFATTSSQIFKPNSVGEHPLVSLLKSQPPDHLDYLAKISRNPEKDQFKLPIFTQADYPGILLTKFDPTPFRPRTNNDEYYDSSCGAYLLKQQTNFWKFIDAPDPSPNSPGSTQANPLESTDNDVPEAPRTPALIVDEISNKKDTPGNKTGFLTIKDTFAPAVKIYFKDPNIRTVAKPKEKRTLLVKSTEKRSPIHDQFRQIANLDQTFVTAFLKLDLTSVAPQTTNHIIANLPQLSEKTSQVAAFAKKIARHDNASLEQSQEQYQDLKDILATIDDLDSRQKLYLAAVKTLTATKKEIEPPNPDHSGDSQIPEKANKQSFLQSLFSSKS